MYEHLTLSICNTCIFLLPLEEFLKSLYSLYIPAEAYETERRKRRVTLDTLQELSLFGRFT